MSLPRWCVGDFRKESQMNDGGAIVLLLVGVLLYFLPSIVGKDKRSAGRFSF